MRYFENGETLEEAANRAWEKLKKIVSIGKTDDVIAISTHEEIIGALLCKMVGLSPNYIEIVFDKLRSINLAGASVLLVEQNARMALDICDRAYVFETGKITLEGTRNSLLEDSSVQDLFFADDNNS